MRGLVAAALVVGLVLPATRAAAEREPDPKRAVIVLEYRAGSSALPGIGRQIVELLGRQTSLAVRGPDQTRVAFGESLDQVLVGCAGDAECVARIGAKVGAAEVILVGVSELGDVILTMQRIDVAKRTVRARVADSLAESAVPGEDQLIAYLQRLLPARDFVRYGVIAIAANLAGATVTVGGERRGDTPIEPLQLPAPATYDIRVEKPGYLPFTTKVALPPDGEIRVDARLARPGEAAAWYQRWYVIATAGVLVAGAGGAAIYFATREPAADGRFPVTGSIR
jgi:hypothetical protein